jgi:hypothetical protein
VRLLVREVLDEDGAHPHDRLLGGTAGGLPVRAPGVTERSHGRDRLTDRGIESFVLVLHQLFERHEGSAALAQRGPEDLVLDAVMVVERLRGGVEPGHQTSDRHVVVGVDLAEGLGEPGRVAPEGAMAGEHDGEVVG